MKSAGSNGVAKPTPTPCHNPPTWRHQATCPRTTASPPPRRRRATLTAVPPWRNPAYRNDTPPVDKSWAYTAAVRLPPPGWVMRTATAAWS